MDRSSPVTRGEFEDRLAVLATKEDLKTSLEIWGGALLARIETGEHRLLGQMDAMDQRLSARMEAMDQRLSARMEAMDQRVSARIEVVDQRLTQVEQRLLQGMQAMEQRLLDELGRHTRAVQEAAQMQIAVLDDKYGDLPKRVKRLETKVFPPPRR
jgi:ClpP class serine protease